MLWRYAILIGLVIDVALLLHVWPYVSDRARRFAPFGLSVLGSWMLFYGLLLYGWAVWALPITFMARMSMWLFIVFFGLGSLAAKAEGIEKRATAAHVLRQEAIIETVRDRLRDELGET